MIYCPTAKMIADFFTKPLQGNLFRKLRDVVMGHKHITELEEDNSDTSIEESVGQDEKTDRKDRTEAMDVSLTTVVTSSQDKKDSEHESHTWKDIVIGKREGQKNV